MSFSPCEKKFGVFLGWGGGAKSPKMKKSYKALHTYIHTVLLGEKKELYDFRRLAEKKKNYMTFSDLEYRKELNFFFFLQKFEWVENLEITC